MRESQKKEDTHARNVRKVATCCVFPMICGSAGSKSRLVKAAGAEPLPDLAGIELAVEQVTAIAEQMAEITRALRGAKSYACSAHDTPTSVSIIGD